jgi:hypothetical protein
VGRIAGGWTGGLALGLALSLAACGDSGGRGDGMTGPPIGTFTATGGDDDGTASADGPIGDGELVYMRVEPQEVLLELDLGEATQQAFTVIAHYDDDTDLDVTAEVTWAVANPEIGAMNGATLDVLPHADSFFGSTILTATMGDRDAQAQVTVAAYRKSGEQTDFFFVLPFEDGAGAQTKPLTFSTDVKAMDVFFNMDTTGSMLGPIQNLQNSLTGSVIPSVQGQVPDTQFGVGAFEDFPIDPYGNNPCPVGAGGPDQPFQLLQAITADAGAVLAGVNGLSIGGTPIGCGGDTPESNIEALYQIATGEGLLGPPPTNVPPNATGVGGVGFRDTSLPVVVSITDAPSHNPDNEGCKGPTFATGYSANPAVAAVAHGMQETVLALDGICARVVQIATAQGPCSPLADGVALATQTGAVIPPDAWDLAPAGRPAGCAVGQCCTGINGAGVAPDGSGRCPLSYLTQFDGSGVSASLTDGLVMLAAYSPFDVTTAVDGVGTDNDGVALPAGTTTADFIKAIRPASHGAVPLPGVPDPTLTEDAFLDVIPDTPVTFDVEAFNDFVPGGDEPRLFVATIRVLAGGCADLDERDVFILVPPAALPPPA